MSRAMATMAGAYVGRRVQLDTYGPCLGCGRDIMQLDPPDGYWMTVDSGPGYACVGKGLHHVGDRYAGTITRVTMAGFTVKLERSSRTIRGVREDDIGQYLD